GSGAERTAFAVMYIGEQKYSVAHPTIAPVVAILDPDLLDAAGPRLVAVSGFDVIGHAMESIWNVNADEESWSEAESALQLAWQHLIPATQGQHSARAR